VKNACKAWALGLSPACLLMSGLVNHLVHGTCLD